jgi:capsular exopolysaccharide synthesis family protein
MHGEAWGEIEEHLVSLLDPTSPDAEQYRALRHVVEQSHGSGGPSVLAVSSPTVGDGKTTTAINLAGALAQDQDATVLLIDADLRRGSAGSRLGLKDSRERGLVDAIIDPSITLEQVVRHRASFNLSVLPVGHLAAHPYELLKSPRLGHLLDEARRRFDFIVLDTPPIVVAQDCRVISKWVDGFLLVVAADRTPARLVEEALNRMEPDKIIGFVFNHEPQSLSYYYAGRYAASSNGHHSDGWRRAVTKAAGSVRQRFAL